MKWYCTNVWRWYGVIEVWLCWNQNRQTLKLLLASINLPVLQSSQTIEEKDLSNFFCYICRSDVFQCSQIYALLILWKEQQSLFKGIFQTFVCDCLLVSYFYPCIFAISFIFHPQKFSQVLSMYSSYITPEHPLV